MKYFFELDERWPDFNVARDEGQYDETIELTAAEYEDWMRVRIEYAAWQRRFKEAYNAAK
jgi:hypothetical protein